MLQLPSPDAQAKRPGLRSDRLQVECHLDAVAVLRDCRASVYMFRPPSPLHTVTVAPSSYHRCHGQGATG